MIIDNITITGKNILGLTFSSKQKVERICDLCGDKSIVVWNTIARCRKKHNTDKDYCFKCAIKIYNTGENNPAKRLETKIKISKALKGKSKSFKDGYNLRILDEKISTSGYILKWVPEENKHIQKHRLIFADNKGVHHSELKNIHHINGDKLDNRLENLIELDISEHSYLHSQLENLAFKLVQKNIIIFDLELKRYSLNNSFLLKTIEKSIGFNDIAIKQNKNICSSRADVNIESEIIRGIYRKIPLIASNMSTVINSDFYIKLYELGAFAILHRAATDDFILKEIKKVSTKCEWVAASIGIDLNQFDLVKKMINNGCNIITIDIAHGYSDYIINLGKKIKLNYPHCKLILGNTTNTNLLLETYDFVDAIKVGIANGLACETKNTAGCLEKQFSTVLKFKQLSKEFGIPIISDGGIREPADFTKAIAAGANSVMAGSIFAACPESAAEKTIIDGKIKKIYAGMASEYVQNKWKGGLKEGTCAEGGIRLLDEGDSVYKLLERYSGALKSGITYSGTNNIKMFQNNVEFIMV